VRNERVQREEHDKVSCRSNLAVKLARHIYGIDGSPHSIYGSHLSAIESLHRRLSAKPLRRTALIQCQGSWCRTGIFRTDFADQPMHRRGSAVADSDAVLEPPRTRRPHSGTSRGLKKAAVPIAHPEASIYRPRVCCLVPTPYPSAPRLLNRLLISVIGRERHRHSLRQVIGYT
jgi:hypothetical protein